MWNKCTCRDLLRFVDKWYTGIYRLTYRKVQNTVLHRVVFDAGLNHGSINLQSAKWAQMVT